MEKKKTSSNSFNMYKLLTILLAVTLLVVLGILIKNWYISSRAQKQYEDLADQVNRLQNHVTNNFENNPSQSVEPSSELVESTEGEEETEAEPETNILDELGIEIPEKNMNWDAICEVNKDIYAWICIPGTEIDYPILQHPNDDTYYLNYNMNGTKGYPGCIYTESLNQKDFTDFDTLIYGHNMRNDTMFASLHYFENQTFFNTSPYVFIYTGDKVLVYQIFAAYMGGNEHILYANDFTQETGRQIYLDMITKYNNGNAHLRETEVTPDSHIITLSTCIQGKPQNRYLVQAVLLNEDALEE